VQPREWVVRVAFGTQCRVAAEQQHADVEVFANAASSGSPAAIAHAQLEVTHDLIEASALVCAVAG
jgi:hypothetical protein